MVIYCSSVLKMATFKKNSNIIPSSSASMLKKGMSTKTTHQLGPENPRPFAVLSEHHVRDRVSLPYIPDREKFMFGTEYEKKMCQLINYYLELNTQDQLCYVGDPKGSFAPMLQSEFCLLKPVTTVIPGHIHYEESPNHKMLPFKVANVGVQEFFRSESQLPVQFDKVLLLDTIQYIEDQVETYNNIFKTISEFGKLLIVHRAAPMCTLPFFTDVKDRMLQHDQSYLHIIQDLQSCGFDVQWDVESLPIRVCKLKWLSMMKNRFPSQLELVSNHEIYSGLRELSEGVMKYSNEIVEFPDRLMFITAQRPIFTPGFPKVQRYTGGKFTAGNKNPVNGERLKYEMDINKEIEEYVKDKEMREQLGTKRKERKLYK